MIREGKKSKEKVDVFSFELLAYRELVNPKAMPYSDEAEAKLPDYFIAADDMDGAEWNTDALGPTKRAYAGRLMQGELEALDAALGNKEHVETVWGRGYTLMGKSSNWTKKE